MSELVVKLSNFQNLFKIKSQRTGFKYLQNRNSCYFFEYFLLNFFYSSSSVQKFLFPGKRGWDPLEISSFTNGYVLPSVHWIVSLVLIVERVSIEKSQDTS